MFQCFNSSPRGQDGCQFADSIFRCIFFNETFAFWLKFHWSLFLRIQQHNIGLDNGLASNRRQAIVWTNADLFIDAYFFYIIHVNSVIWEQAYGKIMRAFYNSHTKKTIYTNGNTQHMPCNTKCIVYRMSISFFRMVITCLPYASY